MPVVELTFHGVAIDVTPNSLRRSRQIRRCGRAAEVDLARGDSLKRRVTPQSSHPCSTGVRSQSNP